MITSSSCGHLASLAHSLRCKERFRLTQTPLLGCSNSSCLRVRVRSFFVHKDHVQVFMFTLDCVNFLNA